MVRLRRRPAGASWWRNQRLSRDTLAMARSWLLSADESRALVVLANSPDGATIALLLGYGFMRKTITALVRAGLAAAIPDEVVRPDGRVIDVSLVKITKTGWRAAATVDLPMFLYRWNPTAPPRRSGGSALPKQPTRARSRKPPRNSASRTKEAGRR